MGQEQAPKPDELREVAAYVEATGLDALASYSDISFPLAIGDLRRFPRASPESQAAERGFEVLREDLQGAVAALHALAAALDNGLPVPPALLLSVQPYVDAFRADQRAASPRDRDPEAAT